MGKYLCRGFLGCSFRGTLSSPKGSTNPLFIAQRRPGGPLSQSQEWNKAVDIPYTQAPGPTIPGSPKAALETLHRARRELAASPDQQISASVYESKASPKGDRSRPGHCFGGSGGLKSLAASLKRSLTVDVGEHED